MRGSIISMLEYEAKQKPAIKALVDRVDDLTDEDIQNAVVPLPWFRQALTAMRNQRAQARASEAMLANVVPAINPDPMGQLIYFTAPTQFVKVSSSSELEVKSGFPLWFPDDGGVWIDSIFCNTIPLAMTNLPLGEAISRSGYRRVIWERQQRL